MKPLHVDIPAKTKAWWLHLAVGLSAAAALVSLTLEFGFDEPPLPISLLIATQLSAVAVYVFSRVYDVLTAADRPAALRACRLDGLLLVAAAGFLAVKLERSPTPPQRAVHRHFGNVRDRTRGLRHRFRLHPVRADRHPDAHSGR